MSSLRVKIWGARGTIGCSVPECVRYGGHTSCVEVRCGERVLVFDAGSGIRLLGNSLVNEGISQVDLLFGHCHHDHICGLPFFAPFYRDTITSAIWSGHLEGKDKTRKMCESYMSPPFFPVGPEIFKGGPSYNDFSPPSTLDLGDGIIIKTMMLDHHGGCVGYRVEYAGKSVCYITDVTHKSGELNLSLVDFISSSDLVIYDATYTDSEFPDFINFGHSTWEEGVRLCQSASAIRYCAFHHRPFRDDDQLDDILSQARIEFPNTDIAYEGLEYSL